VAKGRRRTFVVLLCALLLGLVPPWSTPSRAAAATFCDVPSNAPYYEAVTQLSSRGIINGYANGCFGPNDTTLRAQMAALIARTVGWSGEDHGNSFPDRGVVDADLWRNVGTLAYYDVARGYQDGTYQPTGTVLYAQTVSFITRALVRIGYWQQLPDDPTIYPNIPSSSGHRADIATYVAYAGPLPGAPSTPQQWSGWDQPSTRAWFAMTLWQAIRPVTLPSSWYIWRGVGVPVSSVSTAPSPDPFASGSNLPLICVRGVFSSGLGTNARNVLEDQFDQAWKQVGLYNEGRPGMLSYYSGRERQIIIQWGYNGTVFLYDCPK